MASTVLSPRPPSAKRPKLSLKTTRKQKVTEDPVSQESQETESISSEIKTTQEDSQSKINMTPLKSTPAPLGSAKGRRVNLTTLSTETPKPKPEVEDSFKPFTAIKDKTVPPCVTGLENLGNTCYLNSILQVLRFSPGFEDDIHAVARQIIPIQKQLLSKSESDRLTLSWQLVQRLSRLFSQMNRTEDRLKDTDHEVTAKPVKLLETISELNPLFEGGLQHDAHELLCCLQNAVQDAHTELRKYTTTELKPTKNTTAASDKKQRSLMSFFSAVKQEAFVESLPSSNESLLMSPESGRRLRKFLPLSKSPSNSDHQATTYPPNKVTNYGTEASPCLKENTTTQNGVGLTLDCKLSAKFSPKSKIFSIDEVKDQLFGTNKENGFASRKEATLKKSMGDSFSGSLDKDRTPRKEVNPSQHSQTPTPKKRLSISDVIQELDGKRREDFNTFQSRNGNVSGDESDRSASGGEHEVKRQKLSPIANGHLKTQQTIFTAFAKSSSLKRFGMTASTIRMQPKKDFVNKSKANGDDRESKTVSAQPNPNNVRKSLRMPKTRELKEFVYEENSPAKLKLLGPLYESDEDIPLPKCQLSQLDDSDCESYYKNNKKNDVRVGSRMVECALGEDELKRLALSSSKTAVVKLEKCDSPYFRNKWLCLSYQGTPKKQSVAPPVDTISKSREKPADSIERLFEGVQVLRTRCSECEHFTERVEEYQDISVAVRPEKEEDVADDESQEDDSSSWLTKRLNHVERLRDDNKYYCDRCARYVEAERAVLYKTLPKIITIHLKRFAAISSVMGTFGLTKLNDFVSVPLQLACFSSKCDQPCTKPAHQYDLYGVVMHAGLCISSGHYMAFVKVPETAERVKETVKKTPDSVVRKSSRQLVSPNREVTNGEEAVKKGIDHENDENGSAQHQRPLLSSLAGQWLACDDENVSVLTEEEFVSQALGQRSYSGTPYLLFYKAGRSAMTETV